MPKTTPSKPSPSKARRNPLFSPSLRTYTKEVLTYFLTQFNLTHYTIDLAFSPHPPPNGKSWYASITINPTYYRAGLTIYPRTAQAWEEGDIQEVAETILHEICHIFLEPLYAKLRPHISPADEEDGLSLLESSNQFLTRAFWSLAPTTILNPSFTASSLIFPPPPSTPTPGSDSGRKGVGNGGVAGKPPR